MTMTSDQVCDRHPSARAKERMILPSGAVLFLCGHCVNTLDYEGEFTIEYEAVTV